MTTATRTPPRKGGQPRTRRRSRLSTPQTIALQASAAVIVVAVVALLTTSHGSGQTAAQPAPSAQPSAAPTSAAPLTPGQAWQFATYQDFRLLNDIAVDYTKTLSQWRAGTVNDAVAAGSVNNAAPDFADARKALLARAPFPPAPRALDDDRDTASLYLESARVALVGTEVTDPALKAQLGRSYARILNLGDRMYDQAKAELATFVPAPATDPHVTITYQAEVPDWQAKNLSAGPPLGPAEPSREGLEYQANHPQEPLATWIASVHAAGIPSAATVAAAITSGSIDQLRTLSDTLTNAAHSLSLEPDLAGERVVSTRVELGLLVDAEATRAAEAALLVSGEQRTILGRSAMRLALIGDGLWDARLGTRASGFPASLLTD